MIYFSILFILFITLNSKYLNSYNIYIYIINSYNNIIFKYIKYNIFKNI